MEMRTLRPSVAGVVRSGPHRAIRTRRVQQRGQLGSTVPRLPRQKNRHGNILAIHWHHCIICIHFKYMQCIISNWILQCNPHPHPHLKIRMKNHLKSDIIYGWPQSVQSCTPTCLPPAGPTWQIQRWIQQSWTRQLGNQV